MAWRYRKSIKIAPGTRLNFSRRGVSLTNRVGKTGLYHRTQLVGGKKRTKARPAAAAAPAPRQTAPRSVQQHAPSLGTCVAAGLFALAALVAAIILAVLMVASFETHHPIAGILLLLLVLLAAAIAFFSVRSLLCDWRELHAPEDPAPEIETVDVDPAAWAGVEVDDSDV